MTRALNQARLQVELLEDRRLLAGQIVLNAAGIVAINGTAGTDHARVSLEAGAVVVRLSYNIGAGPTTEQASFSPSQVIGLFFTGLDGDDVFLNDTAIASTASGGFGNDYLEGGAGADRLLGDAGNDLLVGVGGNDILRGGAGSDYLFGMAGNDRMSGDAGRDRLYGGLGADLLIRGPGDFRNGSGDGPLLAMAAPFSQKVIATVSPPPESTTLSALEAAILTLTNQERQSRGLAPLHLSSRLTDAARHHAGNMARFDQMAHTLPGADLPDLESRLRYYGYNYRMAGENIAWNYPDAQAVMAGWMNSSGHRANILNAGFTEIGIGVAFNSRGEPYYCQVFGTAF